MNSYQLQYEPLLGDKLRPICGRGDACLKTLHKARLEASKADYDKIALILKKGLQGLLMGLIYLFYLGYLGYWVLMNRFVTWLPRVPVFIKSLVLQKTTGK